MVSAMNNDVTRILERLIQNDSLAAGELLQLIYEELRNLAAARLAHEKPAQTLQATALDKLKQVDGTAAELVQLRYFAGLTLSEAAEMLDISTRSADRIWAYAKAWLHREMM